MQKVFLTEELFLRNYNCLLFFIFTHKNTRKKRNELNVDSAEEFIHYRLYKLRDDSIFYDKLNSGANFRARDLELKGMSGSYTNAREVTHRFSLNKGAYVIQTLFSY